MIIKLAPVHGHALLFAFGIDRHYARSERPRPSSIRSVRVLASPTACQPRHGQAAPTSLVDAQYSVVFCVAAALARPLSVSPLSFNDALVHDPDVVALARRITMVPDSHHSHGGMLTFDVDGEATIIDATDYPLPGTPAEAWATVVAKFDQAVGGTIPKPLWDTLTEAVADLPAADSADSLLKAFATGIGA